MFDYLNDLDIQLTLFFNGFHTQGLDDFFFYKPYVSYCIFYINIVYYK